MTPCFISPFSDTSIAPRVGISFGYSSSNALIVTKYAPETVGQLCPALLTISR